MKRRIYTLLVMLLVCGIVAMGQIKPIKKPNSSKAKTEQASKQTKNNNKPASSRKGTKSKSLPAAVQQLIGDMVFVKGGTFMMGGTSEQGKDIYKSEMPAHQVTLSSFYICKYEVTQELWKAVMGKEDDPSYFYGDPKLPVEQVSWDECQDFIFELNKLTGKKFRLPTEAEWEYAARGGNRSKGYKYSGSNNIDDVAWYRDNSEESTYPVGLKLPNELGLYDMSGNVMEWCDDWYGEYSDSPVSNPTGPLDGDYCVIRGGGWKSSAVMCRVSNRVVFPTDWSEEYGFRLAL